MDLIVDRWFTVAIGVASLLISIVAMVYAIIYRVRPYSVCFQSSSRRLINYRIEPASSEEEPRTVRLVSTRVVLWNGGGRALVYEDHVKDPIRLSFDENDSVFDYRVLKQSSNVACSIEKVDRRSVTVRFSHLDRNDGVVLEIFHDSEWQLPKIDGLIIDHPKGFRNLGTITIGADRSRNKAIMRQFLLTFIYLVFGVFIWTYAPHEVTNGGRILVGMAVGQYVGIMLAFWNRRKRYPNSLDLHDER